MTFGEAMHELHSGRKVTRTSWPSIHRIEGSRPRQMLDVVYDVGGTPMHCSPCVETRWQPTLDDAMASDWTVFKPVAR